MQKEKYDLYTKKLAEYLITFYVVNGVNIISGLILAGPAECKYKLSEKSIINQYFPIKTIHFIETTEVQDTSIHEIYSKCYYLIDPINDPEEKKSIEKFENLLIQKSTIDRVVFGRNEIITFLLELEEILIDNEMDDKELEELLKINKKISITRCKNKSFIKKFGSYIGIKWY